MSGKFSFLKSPMVISFALIATALSVVAFLGFSTASRIDEVQLEWNNYKAEEGSKGFYLSQIRNHLGYGGLIHHFKNFVLRHGAAEAAHVREHLAGLEVSVNSFRSTTLIKAELEALDQISKIARSYVKNLEIAEGLILQGKGPAEIDTEVRIDDKPALAALELLEDNWRKAGADARDASADALAQTHLQFLVAVGALGIILIAGAALLVFVRRNAMEKNRAREALQESEARLQLIIDAVPAGISYFDREVRFRFANRRYETILNKNPEDLIGKSLKEVLGEKAYKRAEKHVARALAGEAVTFENRLPDFGTGEMTASISYLPHRRSDGTVDGFFAVVYDITKRKEVEDAIKASAAESEARFSQVFSQSPLGIAIVGLDFKITAANESFCRLLEYSEKELVGRSFTDITHPDDIKEGLNLQKKAFAGEMDTYRFRKRYLTKSGQTIWASLTSSVVRNAGGESLYNIGMVEDITERKNLERAEDKLLEAESRYRSIVDTTTEGFWRIDEDLKIVDVNESMCRMLGYSRDEILGKRPFDFVDDSENPELKGLIEKDIRQKITSREWEGQLRRKDGSPLDVHVSATNFLDQEGNPAGRFAFMTDVTEQKKRDAQLRESEERYRELFDDSPVAIWEEDWSRIKQMLEDLEQGGVKDWPEYFKSHREKLKTVYDLAKIGEVSRAALTIFGAECVEDLDEISAGANVSEEELDAFREVLISFLAGQMLVENQSADRTINESKIVVRRRVAIPPKYRHDWSRVIYAIEDVTERKQMEEQLRHAQKMDAVGQLTGGIAHEFNNLLMVVLGNIETMESKMEKDDPLRSYTASAMKGALRGAELTESLLAFSRKQRLETGQTDLNRLVVGMQSLYQRTLGEAITIETNLAKGLWLTSADAGQIEAALLNFVINARDAMPSGGSIRVRTSNRTMNADTAAHYDCVGPGEYVTLEVSDTGTGMTAEELEHAFEPFYSTKEVGKGTGLGLSVAYGFAKQSGGCLEIESKLSHGTTVRLSLPRADEAEPRAESGPEAPAESASASGRILVLEDDAEVRQLVCGQLRKLGYEAFEAADGPAALLMLDKYPEIDLLFSDVVLPGGMSGPETVDKAQVGHPDLKVLFTSGYPEKDVENLRAGNQDVPILPKPYQRFELAEAVAAALNPS